MHLDIEHFGFENSKTRRVQQNSLHAFLLNNWLRRRLVPSVSLKVWTRYERSELEGDDAVRISGHFYLLSQYGLTSSDGVTGHTRSESRGTVVLRTRFQLSATRWTSEEALQGPRLRILQLLHTQINTARFYWSAARVPISLSRLPSGKHNSIWDRI